MEWIIVGIVILVYVFQLFLGFINYRQSNLPIPENVKDIYDVDAYQKWRKYQAEVFRFKLIVKTVKFFLLIAFLMFGVFALFQEWSEQWTNSVILQTLLFLGLYQFIVFMISIPFNYYSQFVIEDKFGFNKTSLRTFVSDTVKALLLIIVLGGGVLALLNWVYLVFETRIFGFIAVSWVVLMALILIFSYLNTRVFVKLFNKLTPVEDGELKEKIENLAKEVGYKIRGIYIMDASKRSTKLNAFFSGFGKNKEVVLFDTLVDKLSDEEVLSVLAHELGHAVNKDVTKLLIQQAFMFAVYGVMIAAILQSDALAQAFGLTNATFGFSIILFMIFLSPLDLILSIPSNMISRRFEFNADAFSAKYVDKKHMISALKVLTNENFSDLNPHPLYVLMYYTHPPISDRIAALKQLV